MQHYHLFHREDDNGALEQEGILKRRIAEAPRNAYISKRQYKHLRSQLMALYLDQLSAVEDPLALLQSKNPDRERQFCDSYAHVVSAEMRAIASMREAE